MNEEPVEGVFRFGAHTDLVFLRETNREFGLGVFGEVMTSDFDDIMSSLGAVAVIPVNHGKPIVLFFGPHHHFDGDHSGGLGGRIWWGWHNHNHFHFYNFTFGLWVEARADIWGHGRELLVTGGVDVDLSLLILPWVWIERWIHGPARL